MTQLPELSFAPLAESALLVRLGDGQKVDPEVVAAVWDLTAGLDERKLTGVDDVVPAYATILVSFDSGLTDHSTLEREIRDVAAALPPRSDKPEREVEIPVVYGGDFGPDLGDVAEHTGLTQDEVIARHSGASYRVACGGFAPGWDYLMGLSPELTTPRLSNPRTRIPPGSVGIGGMQTGVYPLETPGGWRLIGRTPLRMFDPKREDPFLLHPGYGVRFRRIEGDEYDGFRSVEEDERREIPWQARNDDALAIRVVQPGMLTTVQDLGRRGMARFGVAPGGALDRTALILGNRLVGNEPGEAGLEITLIGPSLAFGRKTIIALTGADLGARLNGVALPLWQPVAVGAGDEVSFDPASGDRQGARAYLCIVGGLAIDPALGSRSTDLVGQFGGFQGRALRAGDELSVGARPLSETLLRRRLVGDPPNYELPFTARVVFGPQRDRFSEDGIATILGEAFEVSTKANRTGVRLSGPRIAHTNGADLVSEGIAHGAVQVPGDGQPIVLLAARQTVGGYVKIATVIGADLDRFAQLRPGASVRFTEVSPEEARRAMLDARLASGPEAVGESPGVYAGWGPGAVSASIEGKVEVDNGGVWDPAGVVRVIEAARTAGVTSFRLEIASAGLKLELNRGGVADALPTGATRVAGDTERQTPEETVVTAPVLGVLYRRSAPEEPMLVEEGDTVTAGQTLALIEVMKTYHEVRAPRAGTLAAFLAEDGQFVEYGQPIARLAPLEDDNERTL